MSTLLNLIRIFGVGLIIAAHYAQLINHPFGGIVVNLPFYRGGWGSVGVSIMIILSGLVLSLRYTHVPNWGDFMVKRLRRLYPTYWVILAATILISLALPWPRAYSLRDLFLSITATHVFVGEWGGPWLPTGWFYGLIIQLYAIFPWLRAQIEKRPGKTMLCCFLLSLVLRWSLGHSPGRPMDWFLPCRVFEFGCGIWLGQNVPKRVWGCLNGKGLDAISKRWAAASFPAFLWHYVLMDIARGLG